jgi:hypothetical protein
VAGSIYLRFGPNSVGALSQNQWAPDLGNHDPNPPVQIIDGPVFRLPLYTRIWQRSPWVAIGSQIAQPQISPPPPASPPQIAQYDWPVPRGYKYPVTLRFWCNGVPLETGQIYGALGEAPGYDFPTPTARRQPNLYGTWTQNLLQSTLAPAQAAAVPFGQDDWPNPRPATRSAELLTWSGNLLESTLAAAAAMPLTPQVMPNPPQRWSRDASAQPNLLQTTLAAPQAVPFSQTDWPNPVAARRIQQPERLGGVVDAGDARRGIVLDVPRGPTHPIELRTQAGNLLESTLSLPPGTPVPAYDWPLPGRAQHPIGLRTWSVNLLQSTLNPGDPLRPLDWPLPGRAQHPIAARTWTCNLLQSTLRPQDPPAPVDWPLPVRRTWQPPVWSQNLLQSTLTPGDPIRGVTPPNPVLRRRPVELLTWVALPVPGNIPVQAPGVFGWGARGHIGGSGIDPWSRIGTAVAPDSNTRIGTATASDANKRIGSEDA